MSGAIVFVFVRVVAAIVVAVTSPKSGDAFSVSADELVTVVSAGTSIAFANAGGGSLVDALLSVVDFHEAVGTLANSAAVGSGVAGVSAPAVVELANAEGTILPLGGVDLKRMLQNFFLCH
jgi:hypothetical protein